MVTIDGYACHAENKSIHNTFLVHLSQGFKCTVLIIHRPSSVRSQRLKVHFCNHASSVRTAYVCLQLTFSTSLASKTAPGLKDVDEIW